MKPMPIVAALAAFAFVVLPEVAEATPVGSPSALKDGTSSSSPPPQNTPFEVKGYITGWRLAHKRIGIRVTRSGDNKDVWFVKYDRDRTPRTPQLLSVALNALSHGEYEVEVTGATSSTVDGKTFARAFQLIELGRVVPK